MFEASFECSVSRRGLLLSEQSVFSPLMLHKHFVVYWDNVYMCITCIHWFLCLEMVFKSRDVICTCVMWCMLRVNMSKSMLDSIWLFASWIYNTLPLLSVQYSLISLSLSFIWCKELHWMKLIPLCSTKALLSYKIMKHYVTTLNKCIYLGYLFIYACVYVCIAKLMYHESGRTPP